MIIIQSVGVLLCLVLVVGFGLAILPAIRADRGDHMLHRPESNCPECDNPEGES